MNDLSDLDIVRLCARAMGYRIISERQASVELDCDAALVCEGVPEIYDPLTNKAQALDLVMALRLTVIAAPLAGWIVQGGQDANFTSETGTDLLRAICLCAARVQLVKEST